MNIVICSIATGKYYNYFSSLERTIQKNFLVNHYKKIFLFTDENCDKDGVISIPFSDLPSPLTTLLKFNLISNLRNIIPEEFELFYYIDSDCKIVDIISEEIFPDKLDQLVATEHPWQKYNSPSYETNSKSTACVLDSKGTHYYQASFFGGYKKHVIDVADIIKENVNKDLKSCIIARWHDESHFNKYLIDHPPKSLSMAYAYPDPDRWMQDFLIRPKILHRNMSSPI